MSAWSDLVTTALLGTDRRPLPEDLPPSWADVLPGDRGDPATRAPDLAAAHRAAAQAGPPSPQGPGPPQAPSERLPAVPEVAEDLLAGLLAKPDPLLVNLWLRACAERGLGLPATLWTRLANLAARSTGYDRVLLQAVLGPRGRWFLAQNPQWGRLAGLEPASNTSLLDGDPAAARDAVAKQAPALRTCALILACPDPLPADLVAAALRLVGSGALGPDTRTVSAQLSLRIPLEVGIDRALWADPPPPVPGTPAATLRMAELSLASLERTVQIRTQIDDAFAAHPSTEEAAP